MSVFTYIASDYPLKEVENPHIKTLSVNQALEMSIEVHDFLLEPSFDRDEPNVIFTWLGIDTDELKPRAKTHHIPVEQLTCSDLQKLFNKGSFDFPECIIILKTK